jgi:hypothetical protein
MFLKKNNAFLLSTVFALLIGLIHVFLGATLFMVSTKLLLVIYLFLILWLCFYMLVLKKVHSYNSQYVISGFMILTFTKMILSVVFLLLLKRYTIFTPLTIISNFFIGFFIHLLLQVNYSIRLLR